MNKNQRVLYKALEVLSTAALILESAENLENKMTKEEIIEVINKISEKYTEYDSLQLHKEAYDYEGSANTILTMIDSKIED